MAESPNIWNRSNFKRVSPSPAEWDIDNYEYDPEKAKKRKKKKKSKRKKSEIPSEAGLVALTAVVSHTTDVEGRVPEAAHVQEDVADGKATDVIKEDEPYDSTDVPGELAVVMVANNFNEEETKESLYGKAEERNLSPPPPPSPAQTPETPVVVSPPALPFDEEAPRYDLRNDYQQLDSRKKWRDPLTVRRRNKLFEKPVKPMKGFKGWKHRQKMNWRKFKFFCKGVSYKLELWGSWLRKIEGHQGTGCVSYFVFLRWLFGLNIALFLLMFLGVTLPFVALSSMGYGYSVTGTSSDSDTATATTCSPLYYNNINVSSAASYLVLDFLQGTGWMENTALFYGFYDSVEMYFGSSASGTTMNYVIPLAYLIVSLLCLLLSLIMMARYTITAFKENLLASQDGAQLTVYCNKIFGGWDFALKEQQSAKLKKKSIYKDIVSDLAEQRFHLTQKQKTRGQKCQLYTIRFIIFMVVLILLAGAGAAIYFAQNFATEFSNGDTSGYDSFVILLVEFLPSLTITAFNAILPLIFGFLVEFEGYRPAYKIKITLGRSVFLRLASLAVLLVTIYNNLSCADKETTCNTGQNSCVTLRCWETYVGQSFYKLIVLDFLVHIAVTLLYELPRKIITTKCTCGLLNKLGPAEFDIPKNVLDLVYTQTLCWIGFFYSPLLPTLCVISVLTLFYLKVLSAMYNTVPPEMPYRASRSNSFFMIILMVAFFLCCFPVGYSIVSINPSKGCGPFRIYSNMYQVVYITISVLPSWLQTIVNILTATSMIISILVLLALIIYYCSAANSTKTGMIRMMKEQLIMEGKDKQFLLQRIREMTGESLPGKKSPPKLKTIDETTVRHKKTDDHIPSVEEVPPSYSPSISRNQRDDQPPNTNRFLSNDVPSPASYNAPDNTSAKETSFIKTNVVTPSNVENFDF